jgi:hypothetical protein
MHTSTSLSSLRRQPSKLRAGSYKKAPTSRGFLRLPT